MSRRGRYLALGTSAILVSAWLYSRYHAQPEPPAAATNESTLADPAIDGPVSSPRTGFYFTADASGSKLEPCAALDENVTSQLRDCVHDGRTLCRLGEDHAFVFESIEQCESASVR